MTLEEIRDKFKAASWLKGIIGRGNFASIQDGVESIFLTFSRHEQKIRDLEKKVAELENKAHNPCSCPCSGEE